MTQNELAALYGERCPTCSINWTIFPPVKCDGSDHFRCIECKAIYPLLRASAPAGVREAYSALFEPEESDAFDNLQGALFDIERFSADGKPTDEVCIQTIKRVLDQLNTAYSRMQSALSSSPVPSEWNAAVEACAEMIDGFADRYDAVSFESNVEEQVAATRAKEQAATEIAAAIRSLHRGEAQRTDGCMGDPSPNDPRNLKELLAMPSVFERSSDTAPQTDGGVRR